jgi:hypothetical protein
MAAVMDRKEMVRLARLGALARLQALEQERNQILATFPELKKGSSAVTTAAATAPAGRRRGMSVSARKAVSVRMKKYWADRRKAKASAKAAKSA